MSFRPASELEIQEIHGSILHLTSKTAVQYQEFPQFGNDLIAVTDFHAIRRLFYRAEAAS